MKAATLKSSALTVLLLALGSVKAEQIDDFDYFSDSRGTIRNGVQAVLMCNGLFTSKRNLEQVFAQELAYLKEPIGNAQGGNYHIDTTLKMVSVGGNQNQEIRLSKQNQA